MSIPKSLDEVVRQRAQFQGEYCHVTIPNCSVLLRSQLITYSPNRWTALMTWKTLL